MAPEKLGKYEIRSTLGKGGMGVVYEGWDPIIDRRVAIKTLVLPDATDAEAQEALARFKREAQAAGRLSHPNVVGVFEYGETGDLAFIVMEFVDGKPLDKLIGPQDAMPLAKITRVLNDVLDGLAYCHARGVVHRDIKPANIMITPDGQAKIADFGIARIESSSLTQAGTVMGTPAYMSPEQFSGAIVDARTDLYSTGVLLFRLLTGDKPFDGSMSAIMHKVFNTTPPKPSDLSVTVPRGLDAVVAQAMARRPEDRFATATAFKQAYQSALAAPQAPVAPLLDDPLAEDGTIVLGTPRQIRLEPARKPAPSRAPLLAGVAIAVVAAGAAGAYFVMRPGPQPVVTRTADLTNGTPTTPPSTTVTPTTGTPPTGTPTTGTADQAPAKDPVSSSGKPVLPPITDAKPPAPPDTLRTPPPPGETAVQTPPQTTANLVTPPPQVLGAVKPPFTSNSPVVQPPSTQTPIVQTPPTTTQNPVSVQTPPPQANAAGVPPPPTIQQAPIQQAIMTPGMMRGAVAEALAATTCSFTTGTFTPQGVASIKGIASPDAIGGMRQAVAASAPGVTTNWDLLDVDPQFCPVLDLLRGLAPVFGAPRDIQLSLRNGKTRLVTDEYILPRVQMPGYGAYLVVDYFVHDGTVTHLYPNKDDPAANNVKLKFAERAQAAMSDKRGSFLGWQVYDPYGRDLIIAIASSSPVMGIRPVDDATKSEPSAPYLADLTAALAEAKRRGDRISVDALVLDTAQAPTVPAKP
jgi:predicted Ser/Thr protein kinase